MRSRSNRLHLLLLMHCAGFCSLLASAGAQDVLPTTGSVEPTPGSTQIYQPPPTVHMNLDPSTQPPPTVQFEAGSCFYFNSRTNVSRRCALTSPDSSCFSFIRLQSDGSYRIKRGCSMGCQSESRRRKIQVCCNTSLCNTHELSETNFTATPPPPPQCYQTLSNGTCRLSTACYTRLTYQPDGTYQLQQGCFRGPECVDESDDRTVRRCCNSHLCNTPIQPSDHPRNLMAMPTFSSPANTPPAVTNFPPTTSSFIPPGILPAPFHTATPADPSPPPLTFQTPPRFSTPPRTPAAVSDSPPTASVYVPPSLLPGTPSPSTSPTLSCHCSGCQTGTCQGVRCATYVTYTRSSQQRGVACVSDIEVCNQPQDPTPSLGTTRITCCATDFCNILPTTMSPPATPTTLQTSGVLRTTTDMTSPAPTSHTPSTPTENHPSSSSSSDNLYFTFTAVVSVVGGLIVVGIILGVLVALMVRLRKNKNNNVRLSGRSSRQPSPDCHLTACVKTRDSPLASTSSSSTGSGEMQPKFDLPLRHLGTSV